MNRLWSTAFSIVFLFAACGGGESATTIAAASTTEGTAPMTGPPTTTTTVPDLAAEPTDTVAFGDSGQELGERGNTDVALGDLDGDGDLDAFIGGEERAEVYLNDGQGGFSPQAGRWAWTWGIWTGMETWMRSSS